MIFYDDSFKTAGGTALSGGTELYVSDSGATYSPHQAWVNSTAVEIGAGTRMRGNAAQNNIFNISRAAPGSDHSMTCKVYVAATMSLENTGVICRVTQNSVGYWYSLTIYNGKVRLFKNVANTYFQLGSDIGISESVGATFNLTLTCQGSTITGTVTRDLDGSYLTGSGTWQVSPANVFSFSDTSVPLTSNVGLWIGANADLDTQGYQMASASGSSVAGITVQSAGATSTSGTNSVSVTLANVVTPANLLVAVGFQTGSRFTLPGDVTDNQGNHVAHGSDDRAAGRGSKCRRLGVR